MSHYLGIVTAYAAAGVLVWLAALLYPQSIPAAREHLPKQRTLQLGLFLVAMAGTAVLYWVEGRGLLLPTEDPLSAALNQLLIFLPLLIYLIAQRTPAAAFVPINGLVLSLAGGVALALVALAAYFAARGNWESLPYTTSRLFAADQADRYVQVLLFDLMLGALMALLSQGWSRKVALTVLGIIIFAAHVAAAMHTGYGVEAIGAVLLGTAVAFGVLSAIVYTRNVAWFLPFHGLVGVLLFVGDDPVPTGG